MNLIGNIDLKTGRIKRVSEEKKVLELSLNKWIHTNDFCYNSFNALINLRFEKIGNYLTTTINQNLMLPNYINNIYSTTCVKSSKKIQAEPLTSDEVINYLRCDDEGELFYISKLEVYKNVGRCINKISTSLIEYCIKKNLTSKKEVEELLKIKLLKNLKHNLEDEVDNYFNNLNRKKLLPK